MSLPRIGVVIVTMGTRPRELEALLASVERQDVRATRVVLVGNATPLTDVATDATKIPLEENLGCPGGRTRRPRRPGTRSTTGSPRATGSGSPAVGFRSP